MCKIHQYLVKNWTRVWSLIFWLILKVKLRFVLDRLSVFVNIRRYCHTGWATLYIIQQLNAVVSGSIIHVRLCNLRATAAENCVNMILFVYRSTCGNALVHTVTGRDRVFVYARKQNTVVDNDRWQQPWPRSVTDTVRTTPRRLRVTNAVR